MARPKKKPPVRGTARGLKPGANPLGLPPEPPPLGSKNKPGKSKSAAEARIEAVRRRRARLAEKASRLRKAREKAGKSTTAREKSFQKAAKRMLKRG